MRDAATATNPNKKSMKSFTIQEIATIVDGELFGNISEPIIGLETIDAAIKGHATFIGNRKYARKWDASNASVAIVTKSIELEPKESAALIKVANADLAMAKLLEVFSPESPHFDNDIHATAVIHPSVVLGK